MYFLSPSSLSVLPLTGGIPSPFTFSRISSFNPPPLSPTSSLPPGLPSGLFPSAYKQAQVSHCDLVSPKGHCSPPSKPWLHFSLVLIARLLECCLDMPPPILPLPYLPVHSHLTSVSATPWNCLLLRSPKAWFWQILQSVLLFHFIPLGRANKSNHSSLLVSGTKPRFCGRQRTSVPRQCPWLLALNLFQMLLPSSPRPQQSKGSPILICTPSQLYQIKEKLAQGYSVRISGWNCISPLPTLCKAAFGPVSFWSPSSDLLNMTSKGNTINLFLL